MSHTMSHSAAQHQLSRRAHAYLAGCCMRVAAGLTRGLWPTRIIVRNALQQSPHLARRKAVSWDMILSPFVMAIWLSDRAHHNTVSHKAL